MGTMTLAESDPDDEVIGKHRTNTAIRSVVISCALIACGAGSQPGFTAVDSAAGAVPFDTVDKGAVVVLPDTVGICQRRTDHLRPKNSHTLTLLLVDVDRDAGVRESAPMAPGTYSVQTGTFAPDHWALADFDVSDAQCKTLSYGSATAGTVTLTKAAQGAWAGTMNLTFADGGVVTGSFDAPNCPALEADAGVLACD